MNSLFSVNSNGKVSMIEIFQRRSCQNLEQLQIVERYGPELSKEIGSLLSKPRGGFVIKLKSRSTHPIQLLLCRKARSLNYRTTARKINSSYLGIRKLQGRPDPSWERLSHLYLPMVKLAAKYQEWKSMISCINTVVATSVQSKKDISSRLMTVLVQALLH